LTQTRIPTVRVEYLWGGGAELTAQPKIALHQAAIVRTVCAQNGRVILTLTVDDGAGGRWQWMPTKAELFAAIAAVSF
jgi:hypothetical protein